MILISFNTAISRPAEGTPCASPAFCRVSARKRSYPTPTGPMFSPLSQALILILVQKPATDDVAEGRSGAVQSP